MKLGRELLQERPESVARLNQLGYTLIHRPEGLEEGYRLLSRGVALGEQHEGAAGCGAGDGAGAAAGWACDRSISLSISPRSSQIPRHFGQ